MKNIKLKRRCTNCGELKNLLADMIDENGDEISLCEECLTESE